MKKKIIWGIFLAGVFGVFAFGTSAYAAEEEGMGDRAVLGETEKPLTLTKEEIAEISQQLKEIESELMRLSLLVTKLALEEQALALEQRLAGITQARATAEEEPGTSMGESVTQEEEPASPELFSGRAVSQEEEEDVFGAVSLEDEEQIFPGSVKDKEESGGFLAALSSLGDLEAPEMAALVILIFLSLFILVRRLRERKPRSAQNAPMRIPERQAESPSQPPEGIIHQ